MKQEEVDQAIAEALAKEKGKSRWHRPSRRAERVRQARQVLNVVFMIGFVAAIAIYFLMPEPRTQRVLANDSGCGILRESV
jgi:hypothetical protein